MTKVLFVHPFAFYPPNAGNMKRSAEVMRALLEMGCDIEVATLAEAWTGETAKGTSLDELRRVVSAVHVCPEPGPLTLPQRAVSSALHRALRLRGRAPSAEQLDRLFFRRRDWVSELAERRSADMVFTTYIMSDHLIDHDRLRELPRVIDTIDLVSLNAKLWQRIAPLLPEGQIDVSLLDGDLLREDFYSREPLSADASEFAAYDRYTETIAIVRHEGDAIRANTSRTRVTTLPMMQDPVPLGNTYDAPRAFLPTGPNPFNLHGIAFFARRVLPTVRARRPDFELHIAGSCADRFLPIEGLHLTGFVDVRAHYAAAPFMICPAYGGTGQQVKISEAMAHGVPVVALRPAAERSPLRHGVSGLVADTAEELAEHVLTLWGDRALCRRLGEAARDTVARELSRETMRSVLAPLLLSARSAVGLAATASQVGRGAP